MSPSEPSFDELTGGFSAQYGVEEITAREFLELQRTPGGNTRPTLLIDVRTREEQSVSTIPGAYLICPEDGLLEDQVYQGFRHASGPDAPCIVFCTGGKRSAIAAAEVRAKHPEARLLNLRGGLIAYANLGGKLVRQSGNETTDELHGYNEKWASYIQSPGRAVLDPPVPPAETDKNTNANANANAKQ